MFLYNRGHFGTIDGVDPQGVIMASSSINSDKLCKRQAYDLSTVLLDPQYYLHGIDKDRCKKTFSNLCSYPWYEKTKSSKPKVRTTKSISGKINIISSRDLSVSLSSYSSELEIQECIKSCFALQELVGVTDLIIPTPLVVNREDQFSEQLKWLKAASKLKGNYSKPFLATIAISDKALLDCDINDNQMVQTLLDNASVLSEIDGYYIVVEQSTSSLQIVEANIARVLLELSYNLGYVEDKKVIINFADAFGLLCLAVGATAFGSGYSTKERRLCLNDFVDKDGGMSLPKYYSTSLIGDFYSERDLKKIVNLKLLRYLKSDIITIHSDPLLQSLGVKGKKIVVPPSWTESRSNTSAASKHRVISLIQQAEHIREIPSIGDRIGYLQTWLQDAEAKMEYMKGRLKGNPLSENGNHISVWREVLDNFVDEYL
ncbi:hypothetical protein [Desulfosporosinus meridiei]|uniref:Uncharacterized protein n=1 Tax=Desulfosporosinus meridiei (strain ATCC BAA-275 / DSM 13257 / KCTC 12902 / NCIMB 13706 / S10) TaxID=768704 RepID=J7J1L5_DESMD|nr:hypothetical protein [Desulfosporosinus meridiei]AFQ46249.1 hypothetical protein Desmer_4443 [Desulfosporosinus meridiei DSM 13257]